MKISRNKEVYRVSAYVVNVRYHIEVCPFDPAPNAPDGSGGIVGEPIIERMVKLTQASPNGLRTQLETTGLKLAAKAAGCEVSDFKLAWGLL